MSAHSNTACCAQVQIRTARARGHGKKDEVGNGKRLAMMPSTWSIVSAGPRKRPVDGEADAHEAGGCSEGNAEGSEGAKMQYLYFE